MILFDFAVDFEYLFENFNLNMTLKVQIFLHHFDMTQKSLRFTNGEFVESTHYSIKNEERTHNVKVKRMSSSLVRTAEHLL